MLKIFYDTIETMECNSFVAVTRVKHLVTISRNCVFVVLDMCRVLFGLQGPEGDAMRKADLTVYQGIAFASMSGRKKIEQEKSKTKGWFEEYSTVGNYWRNRIKDEATKATKGKWNEIRFVFKPADLAYFISLQSSS